jgi:hypothetical protein
MLLRAPHFSIATMLAETRAMQIFSPIGYAETQGAFTEWFASGMRGRLGWECGTTLISGNNILQFCLRESIEPLSFSEYRIAIEAR